MRNRVRPRLRAAGGCFEDPAKFNPLQGPMLKAQCSMHNVKAMAFLVLSIGH
jgi:hypothetical protein